MIPISTLLDYLAWADERTIAAIDEMDPKSSEHRHASRLYAHIAAAEQVWQRRIEGDDVAPVVWPEMPPAEAHALASQTLTALRATAAAPDGLDRTVTYHTAAGDAYMNTVADILMHIALHGSYHRGQIALLGRQSGAAPAVTDFIAYRRANAIPREH